MGWSRTFSEVSHGFKPPRAKLRKGDYACAEAVGRSTAAPVENSLQLFASHFTAEREREDPEPDEEAPERRALTLVGRHPRAAGGPSGRGRRGKCLGRRSGDLSPAASGRSVSGFGAFGVLSLSFRNGQRLVLGKRSGGGLAGAGVARRSVGSAVRGSPWRGSSWGSVLGRSLGLSLLEGRVWGIPCLLLIARFTLDTRFLVPLRPCLLYSP